MNRIPALFASVFALALASPAAFAGDLQDMKLLQDEAGTHAILSLQGPSDYKLFTLQNPERLVLDLSQTRPAPGFRLPAPNGAVVNVRTGQPAAGTLRIVFDLGVQAVSHSRIERDGGQTRLIVELTPRGQVPAKAVVAEVARPEPVPASAQQTSPEIALAPPAPPIVAPEREVALVAPAIPVSAPVSMPAPLPPTTSTARAPTRTLQDVFGSGQRKLVVAIDAGHGGKDPGAHGPAGVREKAVTLAVARELARQINADPGMKAVLIRDGDSFVPLKDRYMKARSAQADLFISIHADASPNDSASGASVFVLSTRGASSQAARWLADQENAADLVGGVSLDEKDHNLAAVLLDLSQSATMRASDDIANQVLGSLKNVGKAHKPAIERANFVVLRSPDVPSMLIETGFITNPSEEKRLNDSGYRARLATAITDGVRRYFVDQPPPGSWYASRLGDSGRAGENSDSPMVASSPK